jgi:hypothetical protein
MGVSGLHRAPTALYRRGKDPRNPLYRRLGGPKAVLNAEARIRTSASVGDRTPVVQSVVRHYTDWATAAPVSYFEKLVNYGTDAHSAQLISNFWYRDTATDDELLKAGPANKGYSK